MGVSLFGVRLLRTFGKWLLGAILAWVGGFGRRDLAPFRCHQKKCNAKVLLPWFDVSAQLFPISAAVGHWAIWVRATVTTQEFMYEF